MNNVPDCILIIDLLPQKIVYSQLRKQWTHAEFKEAMLAILYNIQTHKLENWLIDTRTNNFTMQDQKWAVEHLGLFLQDTPIKKVALVRNHDALLQVVAESIRTKVYRIFGTQKILEHFETREEALRFLAPEEDPAYLESIIRQEELKEVKR